MKTIWEIKKDIAKLEADWINLERPTSAQTKKHRRKVERLKELILYVETKPSVEFVAAQKKKYKTLISDTETFIRDSLRNGNLSITKKRANEMRKDAGLGRLKEQVRALGYLLG